MTHLGGVGSNFTLGEPDLFPSLHTLAGDMQQGLRSLWTHERASERLRRSIEFTAGVPSGREKPLLTPTMCICGGEALILEFSYHFAYTDFALLPCEIEGNDVAIHQLNPEDHPLQASRIVSAECCM